MFRSKKTKVMMATIAVAATVFAANPSADQASAATYYYQYSGANDSQFNSFLQRFFQNYYSSKVPTTSQTETKPSSTKPTPKAEPKQPSPAAETTQSKQQPSTETAQPKTSTQYTLSQYEQEVITLVNQERAKYGLAALSIDLELSKVARLKSQDMQKNNYFSHTSPTYGSPFAMMKQFGITYRSAAENIAKGQRTPQEVVTAWMNSAGHRKNILGSSYTHIGVGYVASGNYWTQQFIGK